MKTAFILFLLLSGGASVITIGAALLAHLKAKATPSPEDFQRPKLRDACKRMRETMEATPKNEDGTQKNFPAGRCNAQRELSQTKN